MAGTLPLTLPILLILVVSRIPQESVWQLIYCMYNPHPFQDNREYEQSVQSPYIRSFCLTSVVLVLFRIANSDGSYSERFFSLYNNAIFLKYPAKISRIDCNSHQTNVDYRPILKSWQPYPSCILERVTSLFSEASYLGSTSLVGSSPGSLYLISKFCSLRITAGSLGSFPSSPASRCITKELEGCYQLG